MIIVRVVGLGGAYLDRKGPHHRRVGGGISMEVEENSILRVLPHGQEFVDLESVKVFFVKFISNI